MNCFQSLISWLYNYLLNDLKKKVNTFIALQTVGSDDTS